MKIQNSKFKILKRFLPKFLTLVFMLGVFSCQKDDSFNESDHPTVSKDNHEVSTRKLTLHDLNQKQFLNESLAKMESVLDINKTQDGNAKIIATDGSFTVLTEIGRASCRERVEVLVDYLLRHRKAVRIRTKRSL